MVFPIDAASVKSLPIRGGTLEVAFRSLDDAMTQKQQYFPLQSLFIESTDMPPPFSELDLDLSFPDGAKISGLQARVVQLVEHGAQRGFLIQLLGSFSALEDKIVAWSQAPAVTAEPEPEASKDEADRDDVLLEDQERKPVDRMTLHEKLRKLNVNERARLASRADKMTRSLLLRDVEPQVIQFMLKNPHLTRAEVVEITKSPRINYNIVKIILSNKSWVQSEEIRFNLTINPKTPLPEALKLLQGLNLKRLREIAKNHGLRNRLKQTALRMVLERAT